MRGERNVPLQARRGWVRRVVDRLAQTCEPTVRALTLWALKPTQPLGDDDLRRPRLLVACSLGMGVLGLLSTLLTALRGDFFGATLTLVMAFVTASMGTLLLRVLPRPTFAATAYVALHFVALLAVSWRTEGAGVPALVSLPAVPMLSVLLGGVELAVVWGVLACAVPPALLALGRLAPTPHLNDGLTPQLALTLSLVTALVTGMALVHGAVVGAAADRALAARDRANAANRAKDDFVSMVSHELRTPMNGVIGMTSLLLDGPLDDDQRESAQTMQRSAEHLLDVINDLLDIGKIEAGKIVLEPRPLDVRRVIDDVLAPLRARAAHKGIELRTLLAPELPRAVLGDAGRLRQILTNLVGNAVKFTSTGSVVLRVTSVHEGGSAQLRFDVEDTGIGIAPDKLLHVFDKFTQADVSTTRQFGGTGLGLAIAQALAHAMDGGITVTSAVHVGSTFTLTLSLPVTSDATSSPPHPARASTASTRSGTREGAWHVLLADDDATSLTVARRMLEGMGCQVDVAGNGVEATRLAVATHYDVIFMDCHMPELDGCAATQSIRADSRNQSTPVIALTASALLADRENCLRTGMNDHVSKPVHKEVLRETLLRWAPPRSELHDA